MLLHGLTATRRYVVMGSKNLERGGHRVVAYDARGHGRSGPAPTGYGYDELAADLLAVLDDRGIERAVLAGASMGAHTLLRFALDHPERAAALVVITPAFEPGHGRARTRALGRARRGPARGRRRRASSRPTASRTCRSRSGTPSAPSCASGCPRTSTPRRSPTRCERSRARDAFGSWDELARLDLPVDRRGEPRRGRPGAPVRGRGALRRGDPGRRAGRPRSRASRRSRGRAGSSRG